MNEDHNGSNAFLFMMLLFGILLEPVGGVTSPVNMSCTACIIRLRG